MSTQVNIPVLAICVLAAIMAASPSSATAHTDAEVLALEISGELLPPAGLVAQVAGDLAAIRGHDAMFERFHVFPDWLPGMLLVQLTPEAWAAFESGDYHGWDGVNLDLGMTVTGDTYPRSRLVRLASPQPYHAERLAELYLGTPGLADAYPLVQSDGCIDIDAHVPAPGVYTGTYTFTESWVDCNPSGCFVRSHAWVLAVTTDGVALVEESGAPLAVEAATWGAVKGLFRTGE